MSVEYKSVIGYGYLIGSDDLPIFYLPNGDYDYDKEDEFNDTLHEHKFYHRLDYCYGYDSAFFGIYLKECESAWGEAFDPDRLNDEINPNEWAKCEEAFHQFFPNYERLPQFYLLGEIW